ncbi:MAG: hypothetical protein ACE5Q6_00270 [Dehalococcoidia bacterium]
METAVLTAQVVWEEDKYVARVNELPLEGTGDSVEEAQEELINAMRSWIEYQDGTSSLESTLAEAGFPEVDEDTELQLEFLEQSNVEQGGE